MPTIEYFNGLYADYVHGGETTEDIIRKNVPSLEQAMRDVDLKFKLAPTEYLMGVKRGERIFVGLDITDKAIGSILTIGDDGSDKNRLAAVFASQADARGVPVSIFTSKMVSWPIRSSDNIRYHELRWNSKPVGLLELVDHMQTPETERKHPTRLLIIDGLLRTIDGLEHCGTYFDENYLEVFRTILEKGKENGILICASINPDLYSRKAIVLDRWIKYLPERVFGTTSLPKIGHRLGDSNAQDLEYFIKAVDFRWVHPTADEPVSTDFWIPRLH